MAPSPLYVASTEIHTTDDASSTTLSTPAAATGRTGVGDFLLFIAGTGTSNALYSIPSGFTALTAGNEQGNMCSRVFWRIATGTEASSYTTQQNYSYRRAGVFARYRRNLSASPIRTQGVVQTPTGGSQTACPTPTALSGVAADDLVIRIYLASETSSSGTQTLSTTGLSGWNVRQSIINEVTTDEACGIILADKVGATDRPVPSTNKTSNWIVYSLALKAAPASEAAFLPFFL